MPQHQLAQAMQLRQYQTHHVSVLQNVGTMLVVVAVRDLDADFMQLGRPIQLAQAGVPVCLRHQGLGGLNLREKIGGDAGNAGGLQRIHREARCQALDRRSRQVGVIALAAHQVANQAVTQTAAGQLEVVNLKQVKHRAKNAQAAADDGPAVVLHARQAQAIRAVRIQQGLQHPVQPLAAYRACRPAGCRQHVAHRSHRAGRAVGHVPGVLLMGVERLIQHRFGGDLGHLKRIGGELALWKVTRRPGNAAHAVRLHHRGLHALAQNQFGRSATDVQHQSALVRGWKQLRNALVNQPGFFTARYHIDWEAQYFMGLAQKVIAITRFAQRLRGHSAYLGAFESRQPLAKTGQTLQPALHGGRCEIAVLIQPAALTNRLFQILTAKVLTMIHMAYFKAETV